MNKMVKTKKKAVCRSSLLAFLGKNNPKCFIISRRQNKHLKMIYRWKEPQRPLSLSRNIWLTYQEKKHLSTVSILEK